MYHDEMPTVSDVELIRTGGSYGTVEGADVTVARGVTIHFATLNEYGEGWGVWGVSVDDIVYREPRDLNAEPLHDGPWYELLEQAVVENGGLKTRRPQ